MSEYHFIKYRWKRVGSTRWSHENKIIRTHPLRYLMNLRKDFSREVRNDGRVVRYDYVLDWAMEITETLFNLYKGVLD